jgi:hypothetical protein
MVPDEVTSRTHTTSPPSCLNVHSDGAKSVGFPPTSLLSFFDVWNGDEETTVRDDARRLLPTTRRAEERRRIVASVLMLYGRGGAGQCTLLCSSSREIAPSPNRWGAHPVFFMFLSFSKEDGRFLFLHQSAPHDTLDT